HCTLPLLRYIISHSLACRNIHSFPTRRSSDLQAWDYIMRMVTRFDFVLPAHGKDPLIYIAILLVVEWLQREKQFGLQIEEKGILDRKSTRLNSSHVSISYAVFCLKKKKTY